VRGLQKNQLFHSQIKTRSQRAKVGIQKILQVVQKEYPAQRSEEITSHFGMGSGEPTGSPV